MKTFIMIKTDVPGQYVTEQVVMPDPGDTVQFVYPDKDPVTVRFDYISGSGYMQCHECPLDASNVCSSRRRARGGFIMPMCDGRDGSLYRITRVGDVMEEV